MKTFLILAAVLLAGSLASPDVAAAGDGCRPGPRSHHDRSRHERGRNEEPPLDANQDGHVSTYERIQAARRTRWTSR